jgi:prevent-host-death family protein
LAREHFKMISVDDAKTHFSKLLEEAHGGKEIILAKAGVPYARLMPLVQPNTARMPERIPEIDDKGYFDPLPEGELAT